MISTALFQTISLFLVLALAALAILYFNQRQAFYRTSQQILDANTRQQVIKDLLEGEEKASTKKVNKVRKTALICASEGDKVIHSKSNSSTSLEFQSDISIAEEESMHELLLQSELSSSQINHQAIGSTRLTKKSSSSSFSASDSSDSIQLTNVEPKMIPQRIPVVQHAVESIGPVDASLGIQDMKKELLYLKKANRTSSQGMLSAQSSLREAANKITRLENELWEARQDSKTAGFEHLRQENSRLSTQLTDTLKYLHNIQSENKQLKNLLSSSEDKFSLDRFTYENKLSEAGSQVCSYKTQISLLDKKIASLTNAKVTDQEELSKYKRIIQALSASINSVTFERDTLRIEKRWIVEERAKFDESLSFQNEKEAAAKPLNNEILQKDTHEYRRKSVISGENHDTTAGISLKSQIWLDSAINLNN